VSHNVTQVQQQLRTRSHSLQGKACDAVIVLLARLRESCKNIMAHFGSRARSDADLYDL
jgi:hypothetical protein